MELKFTDLGAIASSLKGRKRFARLVGLIEHASAAGSAAADYSSARLKLDLCGEIAARANMEPSAIDQKVIGSLSPML